jgi:hypothetical protein
VGQRSISGICLIVTVRGFCPWFHEFLGEFFRDGHLTASMVIAKRHLT